jgi:nitrogen regulatory protein PII-like uncharacterized protein
MDTIINENTSSHLDDIIKYNMTNFKYQIIMQQEHLKIQVSNFRCGQQKRSPMPPV